MWKGTGYADRFAIRRVDAGRCRLAAVSTRGMPTALPRRRKPQASKRIDYFVATHYHTDHVGGVPELSERLPIRTFVDHGPSVESGPNPDRLFNAYASVRAKAKHLQVKPGDSVPVKGLEVKVVSAGGEAIANPLAGGGEPNPLCASFQPRAEDKSENARSVGTLITFGKFRFIDLGDLTWNKENELVCPNNRIGKVDVYLTTHHGMDISGPQTIVHALHPRVAIMNNGARKGGSPEAWQVIRRSPGLEDIWQVHFAVAGGKENNSPDTFIANTDENCERKVAQAFGAARWDIYGGQQPQQLQQDL